jgi:ABC-type phosphate/phosphonate transport system substrate-binding protein
MRKNTAKKTNRKRFRTAARAAAIIISALLPAVLSLAVSAADIDRVDFDMNLPPSLLGVGSAEFYHELRAFSDILKGKAEIEFNVNITDSMNGIVRRLEAGKTDIAWMPPYYYERARAVDPGSKIRPLVIYESDASIKSAVCICVRAGGGIKKVDDLRGKRISYPDEVGWIMLNYIYSGNKQATGVGRDFAKYRRLARESSALALRYNAVDAIVIEQLYLDYLPAKKEGEPDIATLACTEPLPNTTLVYRSNFDPRMREVMELIFTSMNSDQIFAQFRRFFKRNSGQWVAASDKDLEAWKKIYFLSVKNGWEKRYKYVPK